MLGILYILLWYLTFEKPLCSVAEEIRYTLFFFILFNKLFNIDIYWVFLILLLLLLLPYITFVIS